MHYEDRMARPEARSNAEAAAELERLWRQQGSIVRNTKKPVQGPAPLQNRPRVAGPVRPWPVIAAELELKRKRLALLAA